MPYGWGTGGIQITASVIGDQDVLKVIDQGADDTTNAVSIRQFFKRVSGAATTERTADATLIQTRHRIPETPLEETMGALDYAVRSGKALYAGISSYTPEQTIEAARILKELGTPLPIRQFLYEQIAEALRQPAVRDRLTGLGNTIPEGMTPERTRDFIASEIERWVPIVRATGARVD